MNSSPLPFVFFLSLLFSLAIASSPVLVPIAFDPSTSLYSITILQTSHSSPHRLLLDLSNSILWVDCLHPLYSSSSLQPVPCRSSVCNQAKVCSSLICAAAGCASCDSPPSPVCQNNSCSPVISNSAIKTSTSALLWSDTIALRSTNGFNPGPFVSVPKFSFACGDNLLLQNNGVPAGVVGVAALSRALLALPTQLAAKLRLQRKFAYCLPSTAGSSGVAFFGESVYGFQQNKQISQSSLHFTPLLTDKTQPDEYLIGVKAISVNGQNLGLSANLLKGGTRISSTVRYTQLQTSIYTALRDAFRKAAAARGIRQVTAVAPFDTCFDPSTASSTRIGYNVPEIDLSLQGSTVWQFFGANSVVTVNNVICLAFQTTPEYETRSIVIGTFQQQDAFLQFDLAASRLGFVPTLLGIQTTCSNFNFTLNS